LKRGGCVVVRSFDFIDMDLPEHRAAATKAMNRAIATDRNRTRESLGHVLCETRPTCQGRGEIKTAQTVCYEILREIMREAKQFNPREFRILASQAVIDLFLDDESATLAQLSVEIGKPVSLLVEAGYSQEKYDIVLL
jgi:ribonuclease G